MDHKELSALNQNCFRLYLQLGAAGDSCSKAPGCLEIFGVESRCLSDPVKAFLQGLLDASKDLESFVLEQIDSQESELPYPDKIEEIRQSFPFVIDRSPEWNDLTVKELRRKLKAIGGVPSNMRKAQLIAELTRLSGNRT
eukprot:CAMPEP_0172170732 /NCGR_PEP_ID=MMETSP1050-20130122/11447_1 /TAXON_ID=233186 /ORGANISM="Cryptomonas curvata, Strain CCAP979/52" /LENGTH=139 /DNA_ID=CAMNT_0012841979 /DNA_START=623 /DNA_END=1042 /DNA_ORIENTATION=+